VKKTILFFGLAVLLFNGCSKDDNSIAASTSYYIQNLMPTQNPTVPYLDGTFYEVVANCYDDAGHIVREDQHINIVSGGGISDSMDVTDNIVKVVVSFRFLPSWSTYYNLSDNKRYYTVTRFVLARGIANKIELLPTTTMYSPLAYSSSDKTIQSIFESL